MIVELLKHITPTLISKKDNFDRAQNWNYLEFIFFLLVFIAGKCDEVVYL